MDDDQLRSELERRAGASSDRPDWAKRVLLPAVRHEIDARPQPVVTARLSPKWSVAAVVAALLILIVAVPRFASQPPAATTLSTASPVPSASPVYMVCAGEGVLPTHVVDQSGQVVSCRSLNLSAEGVAGSGAPQVANPNGDRKALQISWVTSACVKSADALVSGWRMFPSELSIAIDEYGLDCAGPAVRVGFQVELSREIAASNVTASLSSWQTHFTPSPNPEPSPSAAPQAQALECGVPELTHLPITVRDHWGLLTGCTAELTPGDLLEQPVVTTSGSTVTVSFDGADWCSLSDLSIDLWHPQAPDMLRRSHALQIDHHYEQQLDYPFTCDINGHRNFVLTLALNTDVETSSVDAFETRHVGDQPPYFSSSATRGQNDFELVMGTDSSEYSPSDVIHPIATLTYFGDDKTIDLAADAAFGLVGPWMVEQLDGDLFIGNSGSLLMSECDHALRNEAQEFDYLKPPWPISGPPDDPRIQALYDGKDLRLPAGTWRISVYSHFSVGCLTLDRPPSTPWPQLDPVRFAASVVIHVH